MDSNINMSAGIIGEYDLQSIETYRMSTMSLKFVLDSSSIHMDFGTHWQVCGCVPGGLTIRAVAIAAINTHNVVRQTRSILSESTIEVVHLNHTNELLRCSNSPV